MQLTDVGPQQLTVWPNACRPSWDYMADDGDLEVKFDRTSDSWQAGKRKYWPCAGAVTAALQAIPCWLWLSKRAKLSALTPALHPPGGI